MPKTEKLFSDSTQNIMKLANEGISNRQDLMQTCGTESDEALEIQQIELEQRLIIQRMIHLELQKEKLKGLLNALHLLDSDDDSDDDDDRVEEDDDSSMPTQ
ncbi:unnamed protein product [Rotaria socialis]|uniref:Uncharacterized protein n=1 Tax=Rotaria socialis TaxID=392032 RepID=A0A817ZN63_9BILA|nr:unnamed protein product [Rotaria socialis]CAF3332377.1 unnamed protein product [Rotaria socialis]CAF3396944.1 unnamed protein product [Rotaria socialis]CAF3552040.1 unnamed protein product [Rotaria socialis]CAF3769752.1 unnamed protein product [Rotaria socialis]